MPGFSNDPWAYLGSTLGRSQWMHEGHNVRKEKTAPPGGAGPGGPKQRARAQAGYNQKATSAYQRGVKRLGGEQAAASANQPVKTVRKERGAIKAFDTSALQQARAKYGRGSAQAVAARRSRRADYRAGTKRIRQERRAKRAGDQGPGPSNAPPAAGNTTDTLNIFNPAAAAPAPVTSAPPPIMHVPNVLPTMGMNR